MGLEQSRRAEWSGAGCRIIPPITVADCTRYPTFDELVLEEGVAGRGVTIRKGQAWAARTVAQIAGSCAVYVPDVTGHWPGQWMVGFEGKASGLHFEEVGGECWLTDNASWAMSVTKVEQTVSVWTDTELTIPSVSYPLVPGTAYIFVLDKFGKRNAVGHAVVVVPAP